MKISVAIFSLAGLLPVSLFWFSNAMAQKPRLMSDFSSCQLLGKSQIKQLRNQKIHFQQLSNGLKVYILPNWRQPIFSLRLLFDVGAADETAGQSGYAHLFEHLMFKGSKNVPDGGHFAAIKTMGGHINAVTDYDKTVYWTDAPSDFLPQVLWLEAERLKNLTITKQKLENQRQAVLEEKLLRIDNVPYFKIASEFMVSAWQGTDYDHLIIGSDEDIRQASVKDVQHFFRQYYHPHNAILVLVGAVEPEAAHNLITELFMEPRATFKENSVSHEAIKTASLSGKTEIRYDPLAPFPLYTLGWHTVGKNNPDFYAVELLADILLYHEASRLKQHLKERQPLVFDTLGFPLTFEQAGITAMGMVPHSYTRFSSIKEVIKQQLHQIREYGVTDAELCSAKKHRQLLLLKKMDNNRAMAGLISENLLFFRDPWHHISALNSYAEVDNEQIKAVARRYFHEDWLALEIVPGPGMRLVKWLMEILPESLSKSLEKQFL